MKSNIVALAIVSLGICFVIGSWLIADGLHALNETNTKQIVEQKDFSQQPQFMTTKELAEYLGIPQEEVYKLGPSVGGDYVTTSILPFVKIGNKVYFSKIAIDEWLEKGDSFQVE